MWFFVVALLGFASYDIGVIDVDGYHPEAWNDHQHNVCQHVPDSMGPDPICVN